MAVFRFLLLSMLLASNAFSQEVPVVAPRAYFTVIPIRLIFRDLNLGAAIRIQETKTVELRLGWVHSNRWLHHNLYEPAATSTEMNYSGPSVYFQFNKWRKGKADRLSYVGFIAGYRYLYYTDKTMWMGGFGGSSYDEELLLSQWRNDIFLLGTIGFKSSKISTAEVSIGIRINCTHTNVVDTKFHFTYLSPQEYEQYKASAVEELPYSEGWGVLPVIRFTSRLGWFVN
jgi:hypothetical protein